MDGCRNLYSVIESSDQISEDLTNLYSRGSILPYRNYVLGLFGREDQPFFTTLDNALLYAEWLQETSDVSSEIEELGRFALHHIDLILPFTPKNVDELP